MLARLRCWWRQSHDPLRHPLGGFLCIDCRTPIADIGYVNPARRVYERGRGGGLETVR